MENSDCQQTDAGTQTDNSVTENLSSTKIFLMPTLIEELKPVVLMKYGFEYRKKNKIKINSEEFLDYQDTDAREKTHDKLLECS